MESYKTLDKLVSKEDKSIFNRLGELSRDGYIVRFIDKLHEMKVPGHERQTLTFLCVDEGEYENYARSNKLVILNNKIDIYNDQPCNVFDDGINPRQRINESRKHEGICVFNNKSNEIIHNGVFLKVSHDKSKVYGEFGVENDYELIKKTDYLSDLIELYGEKAELGSKSRAMLYFSKVNNATFMRFNNNCYIIKKGKVVYSKKHKEFKPLSLF
ncbi:MAG: hypothetical protein PHV16_02930 [Candidatus Nanoarchaeia archaeon]|nr:hypothetical protein [Candidatus Nanoarchaeia archaeon]